jgi:two-component system, NarL family, vancomycin resistance associated response regulator VraR
MSKSILLADNSETSRKVTRLYLESQIGLTVCGEAVDGLDAIEKAKALKPDLILLDLAMPGMNGIEAASVLKSMMPRVRIILFTLYKEAVEKSLAAAVGVDAVIAKPDGVWKLGDCMRHLLRVP